MPIVSTARRRPTSPRNVTTPTTGAPSPTTTFLARLADLLSSPLRWLSWMSVTSAVVGNHDEPELAADAVVDVVDWAESASQLAEQLVSHIAEPYRRAANDVVPGAFSPTDALTWARAFAAERVVGINETTKLAIRRAVVDGLTEGRSVDDVAREVRGVVGLPPQWASGVGRFNRRAADRNVIPARRAQMVENYRQRLVESRAQTIAATELLMASAQGRLEGYRQMERNVGPGAVMEKEWLTARETSKQGRVVCAICKPLNHKKVRGLDTLFVSGPVAVAVPPAHTRCRCTFVATVVQDTSGGTPPPDAPSEPPASIVSPASDPTQDGVSATSTLASLPPERGEIGREVRHGLRAIERVHRVPNGMTPVPVKESTARSYFGAYEYLLGSGEPVTIRISRHGDHKATTFAHEFGHYLDGQGELVGQRRGISATSPIGRQDPLMSAFFDAINASPSIQAMRSHAATARRDDPSHYFLQTAEIWARAYAQWIATRSEDPEMLRQVERIRNVDGVRALSQWTPEEFAPIADTLEAIFRERGLL